MTSWLGRIVTTRPKGLVAGVTYVRCGRMVDGRYVCQGEAGMIAADGSGELHLWSGQDATRGPDGVWSVRRRYRRLNATGPRPSSLLPDALAMRRQIVRDRPYLATCPHCRCGLTLAPAVLSSALDVSTAAD